MSTIDKSPIALSESQMTAVLFAAAPLHREAVEGYLQSVAEQLRACPVIGDGSVHRAIEVAQHKFLDPPVLDRGYGTTKYDR
jgi:hypothetical protein